MEQMQIELEKNNDSQILQEKEVSVESSKEAHTDRIIESKSR